MNRLKASRSRSRTQEPETCKRAGQQTFGLTIGVGGDGGRRTCSGTGTFATDADAVAPQRRLFGLRVGQRPFVW